MMVLDGHSVPITALAYSPDGMRLATAGRDGSLLVRQVPNVERSLSHSTDPILAVGFSPGGEELAIGRKKGTVQFVPLTETARAPVETPTLTGPVAGFAFTGVEHLIAVGIGERNLCRSGEFLLWDRRRRAPAPHAFPEPAGVWCVASFPTTKTVAWGTGTGAIHVWEITTSGPQRFRLGKPAHALSFAVDGRTLAVANDWKITILDLARRQEKRTLSGHKGIVTSLGRSPDGRYLLSGSWDKTVCVWEEETGQLRGSWELPVGRIYCVGVSPDGLTACAGGEDGSLVIWDLDL